MNKITLSIADDHPVVRSGLISFLGRDSRFEIKGEYGTEEELYSGLDKVKSDLIILDLLMPGSLPEMRVKKVKELCPDSKIVILTSSRITDHILPVLSSGASAYLLKEIEPEQLIISLINISTGQQVFDPYVSDYLITARLEEKKINDLSAREKDVLMKLSRGLTNKEIASELFISEATVKTHVSNLLGKLDQDHRTGLALYALNHLKHGQ